MVGMGLHYGICWEMWGYKDNGIHPLCIPDGRETQGLSLDRGRGPLVHPFGTLPVCLHPLLLPGLILSSPGTGSWQGWGVPRLREKGCLTPGGANWSWEPAASAGYTCTGDSWKSICFGLLVSDLQAPVLCQGRQLLWLLGWLFSTPGPALGCKGYGEIREV